MLPVDFVESSGARTKDIYLQSHVLQHGDKEIAQGLVLHVVEDEVLAVHEAASSEEDWQVGAIVDVRVAEVAAVEDHRLIEKARSTGGGRGRERSEEFA
jgi:hypothetical protein